MLTAPREATLLAREAALDSEYATFFRDRDAARAELQRAEVSLFAREARSQLRLEGLASRLAAAFARLVRLQPSSPSASTTVATYDPTNPCADEWHTPQCRSPIPYASASTRPQVLNTGDLADRTFKHTHGFPMFATNAAIVGAPSLRLHTLRITPMALSCSPIELTRVIASNYRENSHALLVAGLGPLRRRSDDGRSGALASSSAAEHAPRVRLNFSNAEDPRGVVQGGHLWLFYTTTIQIYFDGKVKPQEQGRMELRRFDYPALRRQSQWCHFQWEGNLGVQKNWVALEMREEYVLFSHTLEPHTVLHCALPSHGKGGGANRRYRRRIKCNAAAEEAYLVNKADRARTRRGAVGGGSTSNLSLSCVNGFRVEWANQPSSPESKCTLAHKTPNPGVWHRAGFHLYSGVSRLTNVRAIPRGGTPCVHPATHALGHHHVCLGHFRARMRSADRRSTYFHFFYAVERKPPYTITNVSRPFRFARVDGADARSQLGRGGVPADEQDQFASEAVQFAVGMVLLPGRNASMLRVTYGIGDCLSATRDLALSDVAELLAGRMQLDTL